MQTRSLRILVLYLSLLIHSNNYHILLIEKLSCIKGQTYTKIHPTSMLLPITCIGMQPPFYIQVPFPEIFNLILLKLPIIVRILKQDPDGEIEKHLFYFSHFFMVALCKNYNLNVTEVLDSTLKKFSRNFQFHRRDPTTYVACERYELHWLI